MLLSLETKSMQLIKLFFQSLEEGDINVTSKFIWYKLA
jgi:hypothetical protein